MGTGTEPYPREVEAIRSLCAETLGRNWREGARQAFAYTRPSPGHYPFQWYWDSCFAATVWRRFDAGRARRELESLIAAQCEDGFIGHTIFWDTPLDERQRLTYNVLTPHDEMTASIQPPTLSWAWRIAAGDPAEVPAIGRHYDWLSANRDLYGDGLVWIVQPDESGLDASPQFDAIWHGHAGGLPGFVRLVRRNREHGYDLRRIAADGGPVCCAVMTNVFRGLSVLALGRPSLTGVIVDRMYDEEAGLFRPIARPEPEREPTVTWAFSRRESTLGIRRYWRGPTWVNAARLLWLGLVRLGYEEQAEALGAGLAKAVAAEGLREYYDPYTGSGMGATDFAWSSLIIEILEPDPRAEGSYLPGS